MPKLIGRELSIAKHQLRTLEGAARQQQLQRREEEQQQLQKVSAKQRKQQQRQQQQAGREVESALTRTP